MDLIQIYQCLCDRTRLRIIHLLTHGPLCVCHFQEVLDLHQAQVSRHLAYLRKNEMVECSRHGKWMIYSLPASPPHELEANLKCLQDCVTSDKLFRDDFARLAKIKKCTGWLEEAISQKTCC